MILTVFSAKTNTFVTFIKFYIVLSFCENIKFFVMFFICFGLFLYNTDWVIQIWVLYSYFYILLFVSFGVDKNTQTKKNNNLQKQ